VPSTLSAKTNAKSILSQEAILSPGNRCGEDLIRALSGQLLMVPCSFISAVYGALYLSNSECTDLLPCPLPCSIDSCILPRLQVDRRDSIFHMRNYFAFGLKLRDMFMRRNRSMLSPPSEQPRHSHREGQTTNNAGHYTCNSAT
jgi:hypothetical protein